MLSPISRLGAQLAVLAALSACGWQLRGSGSALGESYEQKIGELAIVSEDRSNAFFTSLRRVLELNRVKENDNADLVLLFKNEKLERHPLAYSSTGIPSQYELTMSIEFEVRKKNGEHVLVPRNIISHRNYDFDAELIIAKDREEQELLEEMRRELAYQMLHSIASGI